MSASNVENKDQNNVDGIRGEATMASALADQVAAISLGTGALMPDCPASTSTIAPAPAPSQ